MRSLHRPPMGQLEKQALTRNPIAHPGLELIEGKHEAEFGYPRADVHKEPGKRFGYSGGGFLTAERAGLPEGETFAELNVRSNHVDLVVPVKITVGEGQGGRTQFGEGEVIGRQDVITERACALAVGSDSRMGAEG